MRILFIHNRYQQPGGEDVAVDTESELLREKGHAVEIVLFQNDPDAHWLNKANAGGRAIYNSKSYKKVIKAIDEFQPDVIHVHNLFFEASPSILFAAQRKKIPVVLTIHNYRLICANALLLRNNKPCELCVNSSFPIYGVKYRCYHGSALQSGLVTGITGIHKVWGTWNRKVSRYIALTEFSKSKLLSSSLRLAEGKIVVKPNFIYDPGQGPDKREDFFLFVGRLAKEKGICELLNAFSHIELKLLVIGDGPEKESLQRQFDGASNITFTGSMDKQFVLATMKKCKALIFPSLWYEGLPFTIIESLATGTPVLASRLGSMEELIQDGLNGYHFCPSGEQIKQKVLEYSTIDHERQRSLSLAARKTYLDKYHPDTHYNSILAIYNSVVSQLAQ
jgi:glycosyltransferase involved in cell wall biosynthesis